jgi:hypothetical protein
MHNSTSGASLRVYEKVLKEPKHLHCVREEVSCLDEEAFGKFLKRSGRAQSVAKRVIMQVAEFERYLREQRNCKDLNEASSEDLEAFIPYVDEKKKGSAKKYLHSIRYYYDYASNKEMRSLAGQLRKQRITQAPFLLRDFRGTNPAHIEKLAALGIKNVKQMLDAGRTRKGR